jgi:hypothetical protein
MPVFHLFVFRDSKLVRTEPIEAAGYAEAISAVSSLEPGHYLEVWSEGSRLGTLRPRYGHEQRRTRGSTGSPNDALGSN